MVFIAAVYGEWIFREMSWQFEVDKRKGGRMFTLTDGCTHGELVAMAISDYMLENKAELLEISYQLPDVMLQEMPSDSPPMYVTNDRQVQSLIELSKMHVVRLSVSTRRMYHGKGVDSDPDIDESDDECNDEDWDRNSVEDEDEEEEYDGEDEYATHEDRFYANGKAEDTDADYSDYGKVKDEDDDPKMQFDAKVYMRGNNTWCDNIYIGQSYPSKDELICDLRMTAVMSKFAFKVDKSTTTLFTAKCYASGCEWRIRAAVKNEPRVFWVTQYVKVHTCSASDRVVHRRRCTPRYIGKLFIEHVGVINGIVPRHIADIMRVKFGLRLNYTTSYRALKFAQLYVRGTPEDGYANLPSYLRRVSQSNPGSVIDIVCDAMDRFKYCFISFQASILGFQYLRRVIVVDGTHLTGKYGGVLLVAAAQDGNFQIFPLAFAIVDAEDNESWAWFFSKLQSCFTSKFPLVIVSDRHHAIANGCQVVLPWVTRGICYYHLQKNIASEYHAKDLMYLVKGAAYAHTLADYN